MNKHFLLGSLHVGVGAVAVTSSLLSRHVVGLGIGLVLLGVGLWFLPNDALLGVGTDPT